MSAEFHFLRPLWFLVLPLLFVLVWWAMRARGRGGVWSRVCDAALLPFVVQSGAADLKSRAGWWLAVAGSVAVMALAGPVWERLPVPVFRGEAALVIALDLSNSMNAADIKPSRIARAKFKIADILRARKTGQTALLVFAAQSFVVTPLTNDAKTLGAQLLALDPSIMPSQGSEPASALNLAGKLLQQAGMPDGHVLLLTDGGDEDAMRRAREQAESGSYRLSVLGMGTRDGAPVPDSNGGFTKGPSGALIMSHLDDDSLRALATAGHGMYLESRADDSDVSALASYLDDDRAAHAQRLEKLASSQWYEAGPWLLLPLLPLAALAFRRGVLMLALGVLLGSLMPHAAQAGWWLTPDQSGQAAFQRKDYQTAATTFENPDWRAAARYRAGDFAGAAGTLKGADSALAHYNRGNALARQGQLPEALAAYQEALKRAPEDADAKYNKELIEQLLKKQDEEQQQGQQPQHNQSKKDQEKAQNDRGEQQKEGEKGGESQEQNEGATNAGGGARSKEKEHNAQANDSAQAQGENRQQLDKAKAKADKDKADEDKQKSEAATAMQSESDSERAQATEQWLRQIPDDPAGLLRRKFEYQYKQMYGDKPSEGNPW